LLSSEGKMRAGGMAQVVEHLPSKREALNSDSRTIKKLKKMTLGIYISQLSITVVKYLRKINLKEERFILAHSFSLELLDLHVLRVWQEKQCGRKEMALEPAYLM
jgi:hypothetical protein